MKLVVIRMKRAPGPWRSALRNAHWRVWLLGPQPSLVPAALGEARGVMEGPRGWCWALRGATGSVQGQDEGQNHRSPGQPACPGVCSRSWACVCFCEVSGASPICVVCAPSGCRALPLPAGQRLPKGKARDTTRPGIRYVEQALPRLWR